MRYCPLLCTSAPFSHLRTHSQHFSPGIPSAPEAVDADSCEDDEIVVTTAAASEPDSESPQPMEATVCSV